MTTDEWKDWLSAVIQVKKVDPDADLWFESLIVRR